MEFSVSSITPITTERAAAPTASYSQGIVASPIVVTAGQVGRDAATGSLETTLEGQVRVAIDNLEAVLRAAGLALADVIKTTCYLTDIDDFARFDAVYRERFADPLPARSTVGVALAGDLLFEIEAWAIASVANR
jgi:2-iminobutanoate/2-iminopropanoate deaminase